MIGRPAPPDRLCSGYGMIKSATIKNFRRFTEARLSDCRRVNIVVGANGSGKTALLEALFLAGAASPAVALNFRHWRGLDANLGGPQAAVANALWRDIFTDFDDNKVISIEINGDEQHKRLARFSLKPSGQMLPIAGEEAAAAAAAAEHLTMALVAQYQGPGGRSSEFPVVLGPNGVVQVPALPDMPTESIFFPATGAFSAVEAALRFSSLSRRFRDGRVSEFIKREFPQVSGLFIEAYGMAPVIHAQVVNLPQKVPLNFVSGAMNKIVAVLCALASNPGCIIYLDEIENGVHYSKLTAFWRGLREFAEAEQAQIFASTHSQECLLAAAQVAADKPEDFSVIHVGPKGVRQFQGDTFIGAMEDDIEIR